MYSISRRERVCERITRAVPAQETKVRARKMLTMPAPSVYMTTMARRSDGKAIVMSASRMMIKSAVLPRYPLIRPRTVPRARERKVGRRPMTRETLAP